MRKIMAMIIATLLPALIQFPAYAEATAAKQPVVAPTFQVLGPKAAIRPPLHDLPPLEDVQLWLEAGLPEGALAVINEYDSQTGKFAAEVKGLRKKAVQDHPTAQDITALVNAEKALAQRYSTSATLWGEYLKSIKPAPLATGARSTKAP